MDDRRANFNALASYLQGMLQSVGDNAAVEFWQKSLEEAEGEEDLKEDDEEDDDEVLFSFLVSFSRQFYFLLIFSMFST